MDLSKDENFLKRILKKDTAEEIQQEFKNQGVNITLDEIHKLRNITEIYLKNNGEISDETLNNITGGITMSSENFKNLAIGISALIISLAVLTTGRAATESLDRNLNKLNRTASKNLKKLNTTVGNIGGYYTGVLGYAVIGIRNPDAAAAAANE